MKYKILYKNSQIKMQKNRKKMINLGFTLQP